MRIYFDDPDGQRHWLARGIAHRQSVSGLRVPSTRDVQAVKPVRARRARALDRVTVSTQVSFSVTHYFTRPELLGNPSHADLEAAYNFVFEADRLFERQRGELTFVIESALRQSIWRYRGLLTAIDPRQMGASVIVSYALTGAEFVRPEL